MEVTDQVVTIFGATKGMFDKVPTAKIQEVEKELLETMRTKHSDVMDELKSAGALTDSVAPKLEAAIKDFLSARNY